jgi:BlaR1 peptidase M56
MLLSYWLRLLCLVLFTLGTVQTILSLVMQLVTAFARRSIDRTVARTQERIYFAASISSHVLALLFSLLVVAPQYIQGETNTLEEHVGNICIAGAVLVAARYGYGILRAIRSLIQMRWVHGQDETVVQVGDLKVHICLSQYPLLAVAGLFWPRIILSQCLLENTAFSRPLLEIALAHETAHVRQRDNLKHFILASLAFKNSEKEGSLHRWRRAAERAADDDAVSRNSSRAILLAEALLVAARTSQPQHTQGFSLNLLPHEDELDHRIGRLLGDESVLPPPKMPNWRPVTYMATFFTASVCALLYIFAASLHRVAEYVLHLG